MEETMCFGDGGFADQVITEPVVEADPDGVAEGCHGAKAQEEE